MIGMFLSEFLIWNVSGFTQVLSEGVVNAISLILIGMLIYILLFVIFTDIIQRFKVNDFTGVLILGMIYGLLLEGIFATKVFEPGIGPCITGLCFSSVVFTALSWHPLIDFLVGFLILGLLFNGKLNLGNKKINSKEILIVILLSCFWFMWAYSQWNILKMPSGIAPIAQVLVLIFPILVFMILTPLALKGRLIEGNIIGGKFYFLSLVILLIFSFMRFKSLPNKISFLFFILIFLFYSGLFLLYMKTHSKDKSRQSIYEKCFPIKENFSLIKYLKIIGIVLLVYVLFRLFAKAFSLVPIFTLISKIFFAMFLMFALAFPIWVLGRIFYNFMKNY